MAKNNKTQATVYGYGALGQRTWAICETWGISARRGQKEMRRRMVGEKKERNKKLY